MFTVKKINNSILLTFIFLLPALAQGDKIQKKVQCGLPIFISKGERSYHITKPSWKAGQTIKVYFLNGTEFQRGTVEHFAREWERYGNFKFKFHSEKKTVKENTILIQFDPNLSMAGVSTVGNGTFSTTSPSMRFHAEYGVSARTIMHEFGHSLGLLHEQDSPGGAADWNREAAYQYFKEVNGWDKKTVDREIFNKANNGNKNWSEFDPRSVMAYPLPKELFKSERSFGSGTYLSELDKKGIATLYPGKSQPADRLPCIILIHSQSFF